MSITSLNSYTAYPGFRYHMGHSTHPFHETFSVVYDEGRSHALHLRQIGPSLNLGLRMAGCSPPAKRSRQGDFPPFPAGSYTQPSCPLPLAGICRGFDPFNYFIIQRGIKFHMNGIIVKNTIVNSDNGNVFIDFMLKFTG